MIDREIILTPEGLQRLKEEIEFLSTVKRDEVAERIRAARDFGDISENSEYEDAKNEQAMLEARIYAGIIYAKFGFSPGQFADFLLGVFGLDIAGDDTAAEKPKLPEP